MSLAPAYEGLVAELIMDGRLMRENLNKIGRDETWLRNHLHEKGIPRIEDVLFAALDEAGRLYLKL